MRILPATDESCGTHRKWDLRQRWKNSGAGGIKCVCIHAFSHYYNMWTEFPSKNSLKFVTWCRWDKETSTLYQLLRVHPSITSPLCPHVKRPRGSETPQAQQANPSNTGEDNQDKFGPSKLKKLLGLKLRTKKQCVSYRETILKRCYLLMIFNGK